jgi:Methyltransferase domain
VTECHPQIECIRAAAAVHLPAGTTVAVANHDDTGLLRISGRSTRPFPAGSDGGYYGGPPLDSADAIALLEEERRHGAEYFLLPEPQFWWREYYKDFFRYLHEWHEAVWANGDCAIYRLRPAAPVPTALRAAMADRLRWLPDRVLLDDLVFLLETPQTQNLPDRGDALRLYKDSGLVDQYAKEWSKRDGCPVRNVFELGIWYGGSVVFWSEFFRPDKLVAIDFADRGDSPALRRYRESRGLTGRVKTYWKTDQADKTQLGEIVVAEFDGPLDLIIDDASHLYGPTKASFEALFPRLRPGGLYVLEDWAWEHWQECITPPHPFADLDGLSGLVREMAAAVGTRQGLIESISVRNAFLVIERGTTPIPDPDKFRLADWILERPARRNGEAARREVFS